MAAVSVLYLPRAHSVQAVEPFTSVYVPAMHAVHAAFVLRMVVCERVCVCVFAWVNTQASAHERDHTAAAHIPLLSSLPSTLSGESKRETQFTLYHVHASHKRTCKHAHTHQKCHRRQGVPSKSASNHGHTHCRHRSGAPLAWYKGASLVGNRSPRQSRSSRRYSDCSKRHCWNRGETDGTRHRRRST